MRHQQGVYRTQVGTRICPSSLRPLHGSRASTHRALSPSTATAAGAATPAAHTATPRRAVCSRSRHALLNAI